eukprot:3146486-Pyramimonas_sp.AAC.1
MELELESRTGTPIKRKGLKGKQLQAKWVPVMTPPKCKDDDEVRIGEGWVWLQQGMNDLRNTSQRILVQAD